MNECNAFESVDTCLYAQLTSVIIWGCERDLCIYFKLSNYFIFLRCPLHLLSYALEIRPFFMELQWPEFLIMHTFLLHVSTLMLLPGNFFIICAQVLP